MSKQRNETPAADQAKDVRQDSFLPNWIGTPINSILMAEIMSTIFTIVSRLLLDTLLFIVSINYHGTTEAQIKLLVRLGVEKEIATELSKEEAQESISCLLTNPKPTARQRAFLLRHGLTGDDVDCLDKEDATKFIGQIIENLKRMAKYGKEKSR